MTKNNFKLIMENWRRYSINEVGDGEALPDYGTADMDSLGGQSVSSAKEAGQRVMNGMGFACDETEGSSSPIELIDAYASFRESVTKPFYGSPAVAQGDGSTTAKVDLFVGAVEMAFSACVGADGQESSGGDYHGLKLKVGQGERESNWASYDPNKNPGGLANYFGQQDTWEGVGRAFIKALDMARDKGHSPLVDENGSVYRGVSGG